MRGICLPSTLLYMHKSNTVYSTESVGIPSLSFWHSGPLGDETHWWSVNGYGTLSFHFLSLLYPIKTMAPTAITLATSTRTVKLESLFCCNVGFSASSPLLSFLSWKQKGNNCYRYNKITTNKIMPLSSFHFFFIFQHAVVLLVTSVEHLYLPCLKLPMIKKIWVISHFKKNPVLQVSRFFFNLNLSQYFENKTTSGPGQQKVTLSMVFAINSHEYY